MNMSRLVKNQRGEKKLFQQRLFSAAIIVFILAILLVARLFYLQVIKHNHYTQLAKKNSVNMIPIAPRRGLIYDRNGVLLADNVPVFSLMVVPDQVKNMNEAINNIQKIIPLSKEEIDDFQKALKQHRPSTPIPLKLKLTQQQVAQFDVNQYQFPGISVKAELIRHYPLGENFSHILGYVGRINQQELEHVNQDNYAGTNFIGKTGIEKFYESLLHGQVGYQQVEVDASGKATKNLSGIVAKPGKNIYLTIDSGLQMAAIKALDNHRGSVVVIQPSTGQVLALVSSPGFDPNAFVDGISSKAYDKLLNNENKPLYDRALRALYPPGSTVKPLLSLQGLDKQIITPDFSIDDKGYFKLPHDPHVFHDWKEGGHGIVNVTKAIIMSCDTFFYQLGYKMGINNIDDILGRFGYGSMTGIDLPDEIPGTLASPAYKMKQYQTHWYPGDTVNTAIGQGYMQVTPLQLASAYATLSERGKRFKPYLLLATVDSSGQKKLNPPKPLAPVKLASQQPWNVVVNAMQDVISQEGTAWRFGTPSNYTAAAKTGTSQVISRNLSENYTNVPVNQRPNSSIVVFAPVNNPQIAIAVVVEHAPGTSAPIARKVADYYFDHLKTQSS
ncbi:MAG: penicillin-binding protein 2 [Legionellaceae bacterium]|nr:penicillin-binding protein 2 [Legionellaceae bacterium]